MTEAGNQLLVDTKRMVAINDDVFARTTDHAFEDEVLLGVPHDIVNPIIPIALRQFHAEFSGVKVQLISSFTSVLKKFRKDEIDIILTAESDLDIGGENLKQVSLR